MSRFIALSFVILSAPALAHPGHLAEQSGHSHWVALAATLLAAAIVVVGVARAIGRKRKRQTAHD
jgi:hypothetical protein